MSRNAFHRLGTAVAVVTVIFLVLGIGALGIIGAGGENDRMYLGVLAVFLIGTVVARGLHEEPGASVGEILMLTAMYAGLFALSAWLFWRAAEQDSPELVGSRR
jgi:hypothetical protein